jgi:hypothetical protein
MMTIKAYLSSIELEASYEAAVDPVAKSHFHALWLLSSGYEVDEVAELLSFSARWVRVLIKRYNERGPDRLGPARPQWDEADDSDARGPGWLRSNSGSRRRLMIVACGQGRRLRGMSGNAPSSLICWRTFSLS